MRRRKETRHIHTRVGSGCARILDIETKECRNATVDDLEIAARVVETIESGMFHEERQIQIGFSQKTPQEHHIFSYDRTQWSAGSEI